MFTRGPLKKRDKSIRNHMKPKIVYFSSSHRALPALEILHKNLDIVGIISQPDRPLGRKQILTPTAISKYAQKHNLPLLKPEKLDKDAVEWIANKKPDVLLLSYYGQWIPPELFNLTTSGILVTHPSLLPKWRWGSPVQATIISDEHENGVTLMKMDEKFDHGPIVARELDEVRSDDDQESLYTRLFTKGAELALKVIPDYLAGKITPVEQDHSKATFASHLKKSDGFINPKILALASQGDALQGYDEIPIRWMRKSIKKDDCFSFSPTPEFLERFIRAMTPWPGVWTNVQLVASHKLRVTKRLKILKTHVEGEKLVLDDVQLEGKTPVSWNQLTRSQHLQFGA